MGGIATAFFDALYGRFLLRDVFGKILPGWVTIIVILRRLDLSLFDMIGLQSQVAAFVVTSGIAWIISFALQEVGSYLGLISLWPKAAGSEEVRYPMLIRFLAVATDDEKRNVERLVVIKEATGLATVAILVAGVVWLTLMPVLGDHIAIGAVQYFVVLVLLFLGGAALRHSHVTHRNREQTYRECVLATHGAMVVGTAADTAELRARLANTPGVRSNTFADSDKAKAWLTTMTTPSAVRDGASTDGVVGYWYEKRA